MVDQHIHAHISLTIGGNEQQPEVVTFHGQFGNFGVSCLTAASDNGKISKITDDFADMDHSTVAAQLLMRARKLQMEADKLYAASLQAAIDESNGNTSEVAMVYGRSSVLLREPLRDVVAAAVAATPAVTAPESPRHTQP